jgi:hypothetical protein
MTYRVRRKLISSKFKINNQLCKVFLEPWYEQANGFWGWNVGFAVGKSNRQLNDWYYGRKNKRRRSLHKHLTGCQGIKTISLGFKEVLKLRWNIAPGDALILDCSSANPEKQFKAWTYFCRHRPEWVADHKELKFYWTRPPYPDDEVWKLGQVIPCIPSDPFASTHSDFYYQCFDLKTKS